MEAIILAGGFGTRLSHIVSDVPKPMAPINDKPFLEYLLDYLLINKVNRIIMAVSHKREIIIDHFGCDYKGVPIVYSEEDTPLGTGGGIKKALSSCNEQNIFVINGDSFFLANLQDMLSFHRDNNFDITIAVKEMFDFDRYGTVNINEKRIVSFEEKKATKRGYINGGIYILRKDILDSIKKDTFSFEKEFLENEDIKKDCGAYISEGYFIDIGVPEDYFKANEELPKFKSFSIE
jgi:D-glycero-alpha-D-manno-heptose 1-phosphate guanylyltransferase